MIVLSRFVLLHLEIVPVNFCNCFENEKFLQSASISLESLVFRRSFNERLLKDPPVGTAAVPRRNKNGLTVATGRL